MMNGVQLAVCHEPTGDLANNPLQLFPPRFAGSVFGGLADPSAYRCPGTPTRESAPDAAAADLASADSLAIFAKATGIPEVAYQFAEIIGAITADDLFHIPRDFWDKLVWETVLSRTTTNEDNEQVFE